MNERRKEGMETGRQIDGRWEKEETIRCSFLLWKSFQNGVHLLRNGRQRELKLVLQGDKEREEVLRNTRTNKPLEKHKFDFSAAKEPFGEMMNLVFLQKQQLGKISVGWLTKSCRILLLFPTL